ncbi:hypothetical protein VNO77_19988 [Canavalia gladiata]|uniref:Uncharacterized protein n=1 Tax=Canavalia gladiata TaxID=3824 RepID=A0AAN9LNM1_CANGL
MAMAALEFSKNIKAPVSISPTFSTFKNNYLTVYSLMMAGEYIWNLGLLLSFSRKAIIGILKVRQLFMNGFGSLRLFEIIMGSLANKQGRRIAYDWPYNPHFELHHQILSPIQSLDIGPCFMSNFHFSSAFKHLEYGIVAEFFKKGNHWHSQGSYF